MVVGLPPRASWSVSSNKFEHPSQFTAPIEAVNHILRKVGTSGDFIHYAPCGDELLWDGEVLAACHLISHSPDVIISSV